MAYAPNPNRVRVSVKDLQARFNKTIQPRITNGTYTLNLKSEGVPAKASNQPSGTKSTMYEVIDQHGQTIALVHAFVLPDGSYGASGKLDPKNIRVGTKTYFV